MWAVSLFFHLSSLTAPQIICNSSYCLMGTMYYCSLWFFMQLMIMVVLARLLTHYLWVPVIVMDSTFTHTVRETDSLLMGLGCLHIIHQNVLSKPKLRVQTARNMDACSYMTLKSVHIVGRMTDLKRTCHKNSK